MVTARLYGTRLSPFVEKVARGLQYKRVEFELVAPRRPGELKAWNPTTGKMPVLEVDSERYYDSTFILRRLDELVPNPRLESSDPLSAARQRQLEDWSDESLYWYLMALRWSLSNTPRAARQIAAVAPAPVRPLFAMMLRRQLPRLTKVQGLGRLPAGVLVQEIGRRLDELIVVLGDSRFFFAERPSAADLSLFGMFTNLDSEVTPEGQELIGERAELGEYLLRVDQATVA